MFICFVFVFVCVHIQVYSPQYHLECPGMLWNVKIKKDDGTFDIPTDSTRNYRGIMTGKKAPEFGSTMVVWKMNNENELYNTIMFQLRKKYRYCVVRDIMDQSCAVLNWQWGPKSSLKGNKIKNWTADQTYDGAVKNKLGKDSQEPWSTLVGSFWPDFFVHTQGVGKPWNQLISDTLWKNPNASIEYHINKMYRTCPRLKPEQIRWRSVHAHLLWGPYRELWQALNPQYAIENVAVAIGEKDGKIEKIENFENVTIPKEHFKTHR